MLSEALQIANKADVVVAVLGEPSSWSGEASSLSDIGIQKVQQNLLKALLKTGKPVVLVLINGRPMVLEVIPVFWYGAGDMVNCTIRKKEL